MASGHPQPDFHLRWRWASAPLRPGEGVVAAMRPFVAGRDGRALQLGVTPEIARLSRRGIAVDWNAEMIRLAWPGDTPTHRAMLGNWLALPLDDASVDVAFGDGCLSVLTGPDEQRRLLRELLRVVGPGGRLVLRCFAEPDGGEDIAGLVDDVHLGLVPSFGAFKLRLNMAAFRIAPDESNSGEHIHRLFGRHFPDRDELAAATGWGRDEIDSIDAYAGAPSIHAYPSRVAIAALLPAGVAHRFVETAGYPLAERCPLLIVDVPDAR